MGQLYRHMNKYKAKKQVYNGRLYASRMEATDAMWLDVMLKDGRLKEVKPQHCIPLDIYSIDGRHATLGKHYVDFLITLPDGRQKFVETKGFATEMWRKKRVVVELNHPDIPYLVNPNEKQLLQ